MVSGIGSYDVNIVSFRPNKYSQNSYCTGPNCDPISSQNSLDGTNAIANYNRANFNLQNKLDIEVLEPMNINPNDVDKIEGEKIYTSDNKLHSIVQEDENTKTVYNIEKEKSDKIIDIIKKDKNTDNTIWEQSFSFIDSDNGSEPDKTIDVIEYDKRGRITKSSFYVNNELANASQYIYSPNGNRITITKRDDGSYRVSEANKKRDAYRYFEFDKNKQIQNMHEDYNIANRNFTKEAKFYNGAILSVEQNQKLTVPNSMALEKVNIPELKPASKYVLDKDYKGIQGKKTYYSNGMIETNTISSAEGAPIKANFEPDGKLSKLETENKIIEFKNKSQIITEIIDKNTKKTTRYYEDGDYEVSYENGENRKIAGYEKGNIAFFDESTTSGNKCSGSTYRFNSMGMLESSYTYNEV